MPSPRRIVIASCLLLLFSPSVRAADPARSATTGSIVGVVREDARTPSLEANVSLPALRRGMVTDANGRYRFDGLAPGEYVVEARLMGRATAIGRVTVVAGGAARLDLQFGGHQVVADVPGIDVHERRIDPNVFGTRHRKDLDAAQLYRPASVEEIVGTTPGVVITNDEIHLRGGRSDEVKTLIGGIPAFNELAGRNGSVALAAVASLEVIAGSVNPENGNALSGIVSVTTREGGPRFGGDLRWDTDRYGDPTKTFDRYDRLSLGLGGPTPVPRLTWFATYEGTFQDGWPPSGMSHPRRTLLDFVQLGDRQDNRVKTQWKLAWQPSEMHKLTLEGIANRTRATPYVHSWSRRGYVQVTRDTTAGSAGAAVPRYGSWSGVPVDSTYMPVNLADHVPTIDDRFGQLTAAWRVIPSHDWVFQARVARVEFATTNRVGGKEPWEYEVQSPFYWAGNTGPGTEDNPYFATHGDFPAYAESRARVWTFKGDVSTQRWARHRLKAGLEAHQHDVRNLGLTFPNGESQGLPGSVRSDFHNRHPQGGVFLHDVWDFEGLKLSTGLRFDVFTPGPSVPLADLPSGKRYKHQWSPRLGVSHPVTERDALSFTYGWTYQTVSSSALFENRGLSSSVGTQGNPDLEPQTDVSYEAALQHQFTRDLHGQFAVFFRDIYGLLTVRPARDAAGNQVSVWSNGDYASSRGFELSLAHGFAHHFSADLSYTYSIATGVASDPAQAQQFVNGGQLYLPISERALRWDQRHTLALQGTFRYPGRWGMHLQWAYGSGLPFTPAFRNDRRVDPALENSRRQPSTSRLSLSGDRYLRVWGQNLTLFADARNVLDASNIRALSWGDGFNPNVNLAGGDDYAIYFTETGRVGGAYLQDRDGDHALEWIPLHDPRVFEEGRNLRMGLAIQF